MKYFVSSLFLTLLVTVAHSQQGVWEQVKTVSYHYADDILQSKLTQHNDITLLDTRVLFERMDPEQIIHTFQDRENDLWINKRRILRNIPLKENITEVFTNSEWIRETKKTLIDDSKYIEDWNARSGTWELVSEHNQTKKEYRAKSKDLNSWLFTKNEKTPDGVLTKMRTEESEWKEYSLLSTIIKNKDYRKTTLFMWNSKTNDWDNKSITESKTENGVKYITNKIWDNKSNSWVNESRYISTKMDKHITEKKIQIWDISLKQWINKSRQTTYKERGKVISENHEVWNTKDNQNDNFLVRTENIIFTNPYDYRTPIKIVGLDQDATYSVKFYNLNGQILFSQNIFQSQTTTDITPIFNGPLGSVVVCSLFKNNNELLFNKKMIIQSDY